jgi:hypothetical protein
MLRDERLCHYVRKAICNEPVSGLDALIVDAAKLVIVDAHLDKALDRAVKRLRLG